MTPKELKSQIHKIIGIVENCAETSIDDLISNPHWGKFNLESVRDDLEKAFSIFNKFLMLPTEALPDKAIEPMTEGLRPLQRIIDDIKLLNDTKSFNIASNADAFGLRDTIVAGLKREVDSFHAVTQKWMPYLVYQSSRGLENIDKLTSAAAEIEIIFANAEEGIKVKENKIDTEIEAIITAAKAKKDEIDAEAERIVANAKTRKNEIDKAVVEAREAAGSAKEAAAEAREAAAEAREATGSIGVTDFAKIFFDEAKTLKKSSIIWLMITMAFGAMTLMAAYEFLSHDLIVKDGYAAVQLITTRLIILSVLLSATVWCGRIYKAVMHQVTINSHRANSIKTFQAFTKAARNDVTRDAVLTETTRAIFGPSATGYLDKKTAGGGGDQLKVVEATRQSPKVLKSESDQ